MTSEKIKRLVTVARIKIRNAYQEWQKSLKALKDIQDSCPHEQIESWTNDDGDGSFKVEKCLYCGLQKDGGLK